MFTHYKQLINDSTPGRYEGESPMTSYLHELMMNGDYGDDEVSFGNCGGINRYGRRLLCFSATGFISLVTCDDLDMAQQIMSDLHAQWDTEYEEVS